MCVCLWISLTYDSSTVSKGSGCEISWSWLAWSRLRRMMSHKVWEALDCLCERKNTHAWILILVNCEFCFIEKYWIALLPLHLSQGGWALSISGPASLHSATVEGKKWHYNSAQYQCVVWKRINPYQSLSYSKSLEPKKRGLHAADKSQEDIHHRWCINMLQHQGKESLLPSQETDHLNKTDWTPQKKRQKTENWHFHNQGPAPLSLQLSVLFWIGGVLILERHVSTKADVLRPVHKQMQISQTALFILPCLLL